MERGETQEEAETSARREFGNVGLVKEVTRDVWGWTRTDQFLRDVRYGLRQLKRNPRFSFIAILTLAIGIGATTAIFSAVNSILLRPLPFEDPDRLMRVSLLLPRDTGMTEMVWSYPKYQVFRDSQDVFDDISTYYRHQYNLTHVDQPVRLRGEVVGSSYFAVLGIDAEIGRAFLPEDELEQDALYEAVLSHGLWVRRFGADPAVLGSTIHLDGIPTSVVGVMPVGFSGLRETADLWVPTSTFGSNKLTQAHQYHVIARLKSGITYEQAIASMGVLGDQVDKAFPDPSGAGSWSATARPLDEYRASSTMRTSVLILFCGAGLVLLTACVNVAGLVLASFVTRRREMATRLALGSSRQRLVRQLLTENLLLSMFGGVTGVAVAGAGVSYFNSLGAEFRFQMSGLERIAFNSIHVDMKTLAFCVAVTTLTPLLIGLLPAFSSSRLSLAGAVKGGFSAGTLAHTRILGILVITQIAIAFTLLVGSGLLVRTMRQLAGIELGFQPATMLTVRIKLPTSHYDRPAAQAFFTQVLDRVRTLPGVDAATFNNCVPFADGCRNTAAIFSQDGREFESDQNRVVGVNFVPPEFFEVMGVPVLGGRVFSRQDGPETPRVVIISRSTASKFWPGENAVGKSLSLRGFEDAAVIGVVGDVRYDNIDESPRANVYISTTQFARREGFIIARISGEPTPHISALRQTVREIDAHLPLFDIRMMKERVDDEMWRTRSSTILISLFASMTLALSAIGIYGLFSYSVERRAHCIGLMMALGASRSNVLKGVVGRALLTATAGIMLGILLALAVTRVLTALLYETSPHDPATFGAVAFAFLMVALVAAYWPARKASRVNPIDVLQAE
jgi:predicted permease